MNIKFANITIPINIDPNLKIKDLKIQLYEVANTGLDPHNLFLYKNQINLLQLFLKEINIDGLSVVCFFTLNDNLSLTENLELINMTQTANLFLHVEKNPYYYQLNSKTPEEIITIFKNISPNVNSITLNWMDLQNRTPAEIIEFGKALPNIMEIEVRDSSGKVVSNPMITLLKQHAGERFREISQEFSNDNIPTEVANLILQFDTGFERDQIHDFFNPRNEEQTSDADQEIYTFKFNWLYALAMLASTIVFAIGLLTLSSPIGVGLVIGGTVGMGISGYKLYGMFQSYNETVQNQEPALSPVL